MALRVFISSKMAELRDVREIVSDALRKHGIEAFVYEEDAGARPETVVTTSLREVEEADVYIGLFWQKYGEVTVEEYRHARMYDKPCFVYIRDKDLHRDPELDVFLQNEVYDLTRGVTYDYFDSALELGHAVARNVMVWLVRRFRELSAQVQISEVSREEIGRLKAEVTRLQAISREPLSQGDAVDNLARQLREWFHAVGHGLERDVQRSGKYAELVINIPRRRWRGYDRILVLALDGKIEVSHVHNLRQTVNGQGFDEGWLVCERRVTQAGREAAEKYDDLFVYTFDELIDENVNWTRYFVWLENEVKTKGVDKYYVHLACGVDDLSPEGEKLGTSHYESLDDYIYLWLDDPSKEHISILGEFGTGKTWFTLHYAYLMMQVYKEAKVKGLRRPRVPLIIQLRNYARGFKDVGVLLSDFVFREHEIGLPGYRAFEQLNRMGRLLLIFDGFDEMAARVDRQKMVDNFWQLAKVVVPGSKAVLTCRTEHFHYAKQEREVLRGELRASTSSIVLEAPKFEVLHPAMFNEKQIREVLHRRSNVSTVETIMGNQDLVDMARRPVLIELILDALEDTQVGKLADMAHIYYYAVVRKMERDIKAERTFTSLADKLFFLCELAWEMYSTNQMTLNYKQFPQRIRAYFGPKVADLEEDHWHYDLLGQTMLVRDAEGNYSPAHRSLLEFFVAYKFAAEIGALGGEFIEAVQQQTDIDAIAPPQVYTWTGYFRREQDKKAQIVPIPPLAGFEMEPIETLRKTVAQEQGVDFAIALLLSEMIDNTFWDSLPSVEDDLPLARRFRQARDLLLVFFPSSASVSLKDIPAFMLNEMTTLLGDSSVGSIMLAFGEGIASWLYTSSRDRDVLEHHRSSGGFLLRYGQGIQGYVSLTGKAYIANDVSKDPYYFRFDDSIKSELSVPIHTGKRAFGIISFESSILAAFTEAHVRYAMICADVLGPYLSLFGGLREIWQSTEKNERFALIPSLIQTLVEQDTKSDNGQEEFMETELKRIQYIVEDLQNCEEVPEEDGFLAALRLRWHHRG